MPPTRAIPLLSRRRHGCLLRCLTPGTVSSSPARPGRRSAPRSRVEYFTISGDRPEARAARLFDLPNAITVAIPTTAAARTRKHCPCKDDCLRLAPRGLSCERLKRQERRRSKISTPESSLSSRIFLYPLNCLAPANGRRGSKGPPLLVSGKRCAVLRCAARPRTLNLQPCRLNWFHSFQNERASVVSRSRMGRI
jgi:hypothetical protein